MKYCFLCGKTTDAESEIIAKFCADMLFSNEESQESALNSILKKATTEEKNSIKEFLHQFVLWIKEKLGKVSYTETFKPEPAQKGSF